MSSQTVRTLVKDFFEDAFPSETLIDLTLLFDELPQMLLENEVQPGGDWVGITFTGDTEEPVSLAANNDIGLYREIGSFEIHICEEARLGVADSILTRAEQMRSAFRGQRIGSIIVESVSPTNTDPGATLEFEGGYVSGTFRVEYYCDIVP